MNPVIDVIMKRKSMRAYEPKEISAEVKAEILQATLRAPTAGNMMLYSIVDVTDQNIKDKLAITCDHQPFIARAPMVLFPLSIAYAILRYRLLDVDAILVRVVTYILMTLVTVAMFYGLLALLSLVLEGTVQANNPIVIAVYLFILVIGLTPLRNLIQNSIDRIFYRAPADYRRALTALSRALVVTPNLQSFAIRHGECEYLQRQDFHHGKNKMSGQTWLPL